MRTTSILLLLVVVLGFVSEAGAKLRFEHIAHGYCIKVGDYHLGFRDGSYWQSDGFRKAVGTWNAVMLGPFGRIEVPFTATQGLVGFCCILATLVIAVVVLTVRWKKKRA
jgi:hypothetical protein